ncbi:MAG: hypothetical protein WBD99_08820 [Thermodesulfobacteriota bacterium]
MKRTVAGYGNNQVEIVNMKKLPYWHHYCAFRIECVMIKLASVVNLFNEAPIIKNINKGVKIYEKVRY